MEKIVITATAESYEQALELLELGVDRIYIGEKAFGLRLPKPFSFAEMRKIAELVHESGKELTVAVNALMHQGMMDALPDYLDFLEEIKADYITVGDAGVFYICNRDKRPFKIPSAELFIMAENLQIPAEVLVYGASIIHHSKRPLLQNYYNFIKTDEAVTKERDLFLSEPGDPDSHYSVYEDMHGTHIFANNDLDMMTKLSELVEHGFDHWKLDGVYCPGENFVKITEYFVKARDLIEAGEFSQDQAFLFDEAIHKLHPANRGLDTGFYDYEPDRVK